MEGGELRRGVSIYKRGREASAQCPLALDHTDCMCFCANSNGSNPGHFVGIAIYLQWRRKGNQVEARKVQAGKGLAG